MSTKHSSERIDEAVCLYKFTGFYHDYIYFSVKNITSNEYVTAVIRTPWIINYEQKIIQSLENINKPGFIITVDNWDSNMEKKFKCDWIHKAKFSEWAVQKGSIFVLNNQTTELNTVITKLATSTAITSLDENYPTVEILLTVFGSLLAFTIYVFIHIKCCGRNNNSNSFYRSV